jgi:hypothetical protein
VNVRTLLGARKLISYRQLDIKDDPLTSDMTVYFPTTTKHLSTQHQATPSVNATSMYGDLMSYQCLGGSHQGGTDVSLGSYVAFESNRGIPITNSPSTAHLGGNLGDEMHVDEGCATHNWLQTAVIFPSNNTSIGQDREQNDYVLNSRNGFL